MHGSAGDKPAYPERSLRNPPLASKLTGSDSRRIDFGNLPSNGTRFEALEDLQIEAVWCKLRHNTCCVCTGASTKFYHQQGEDLESRYGLKGLKASCLSMLLKV